MRFLRSLAHCGYSCGWSNTCLSNRAQGPRAQSEGGSKRRMFKQVFKHTQAKSARGLPSVPMGLPSASPRQGPVEDPYGARERPAHRRPQGSEGAASRDGGNMCGHWHCQARPERGAEDPYVSLGLYMHQSSLLLSNEDGSAVLYRRCQFRGSTACWQSLGVKVFWTSHPWPGL